MPGCWKEWNGLEEVTEVTAFWGEGIGRNSHTLELQELGGFLIGVCVFLSVLGSPGSVHVCCPACGASETSEKTLLDFLERVPMCFTDF